MSKKNLSDIAKTKLLPALLILTAFALPLMNHNAYHIDVLVTAGIFIILALGLNVIVGFAGILHLGYAAPYAIGAYAYALLNIHWHVPFWPGLLFSSIIAALFGMLFAFPALRLGGDYLAIVTLGAGEIIRIALNNLDELTGGPNGLLGIDHPDLFFKGTNFGVQSSPYYFLVLAIILILIFFLRRVESSPLGRAWVAMREDELAASCMGINLMRTKLYAFGLGSFIAGLAGCIFAAKQGTISPDSFDFVVSVMVLAMVVLGGLGNISGVILGAFVLSLLPEFLRGFDAYRMLLFGASMLIIMLLKPQGILSEKRHRAEYAKHQVGDNA